MIPQDTTSATADPEQDDARTLRDRVRSARAQAELSYYELVQSTLRREAFALGVPMASRDEAVPSRLDSVWPGGDRYAGSQGDMLEQPYGDLRSLRDRAAFLEADNWLACGVLDRSCENVVGTAIRIEPRTPNKAFNAAVRKWWKKWANTTSCDVRRMHTFGGILRLFWRTVLRDGDCALLLTYSTEPDGTRKPELQLIEPHRIESPPGGVIGATGMGGTGGIGRLANGNQIADGVEMNAVGAPVAYHVRYTDAAGMVRHQRVPARDMVFYRRANRYSVVRGESAFQGGFRLFEQVVGYLEAVVVSARVGASQSMIRKTKNPAQVLGQLKSAVSPDGRGGAGKVTSYPIQAGAINVIPTDDDLVAFNPSQPQQQFPAALDAFCRILGTKFGLTLEQVLLNFSQTTYSSGKMAQNQARTTAAIGQEDLATLAVTRVYQWALSLAIESGEVVVPADVEEPWEHEWIPPAKPSPEPLKDMQAREMALKLNLDTESNMAMEDGYDFAELCDQRKRDRQMMAEAGLTTETATPGVEIDENGNLKVVAGGKGGTGGGAGGGGGEQGLNGAQIEGALSVLSRLRDGALSTDSAVELLTGLGFASEQAEKIAGGVTALDAGAGDVEFKREVLKSLLAVPAAREALYNAMDIEDLVSATGLPPENGYQAPYIPVVAPNGPLVSGATITDPNNDIVGGDIENDLPAEQDGRNSPPSPAAVVTDDSAATSTAGRTPESPGAATGE